VALPCMNESDRLPLRFSGQMRNSENAIQGEQFIRTTTFTR
jgi:hypothetical protein